MNSQFMASSFLSNEERILLRGLSGSSAFALVSMESLN